MFFNDWIKWKFNPEKKWQEQREFLEIELPDTVMLILVSCAERIYLKKFRRELFLRSFTNELWKNYEESDRRVQAVYVFMNRYQDAVGMIGGYKGETENLQEIISEK